MIYFLPLFLVVFANTSYHLVSKTVSSTANTFLLLAITYGVAFLNCIGLYFLTKEQSIHKDVSNLQWGSFLLGFIIIGIEGGYMWMYKNGWDISKGSLYANIGVACILFLIGYYFFHEQMNLYKLMGLLVCLLGIGLMNFHS